MCWILQNDGGLRLWFCQWHWLRHWKFDPFESFIRFFNDNNWGHLIISIETLILLKGWRFRCNFLNWKGPVFWLGKDITRPQHIDLGKFAPAISGKIGGYHDLHNPRHPQIVERSNKKLLKFFAFHTSFSLGGKENAPVAREGWSFNKMTKMAGYSPKV